MGVKSLILAPNGGILSRERERVVLPPEFLKMLAVLGDTGAQIDLGLHCARCKQDLVGRNGTHDAEWTLDCECRRFVGENPMRAH